MPVAASTTAKLSRQEKALRLAAHSYSAVVIEEAAIVRGIGLLWLVLGTALLLSSVFILVPDLLR